MRTLPLATILVIVASSAASAGWFGPSTYNECVLDKMKGQSMYMMSTVQSVCREKFPRPPCPGEASQQEAMNAEQSGCGVLTAEDILSGDDKMQCISKVHEKYGCGAD